jgi:hypothetical protein
MICKTSAKYWGDQLPSARPRQKEAQNRKWYLNFAPLDIETAASQPRWRGLASLRVSRTLGRQTPALLL